MLPLLPPKSCNLGVFTIMSMGLYCFDFRPLLGDLGELLSANESQRLLAVAGARHRRADALSSPLCCSARLPAVMFTIVLMSVKKFFMQPNYVMPSCLSNPTPNLAESCCPYYRKRLLNFVAILSLSSCHESPAALQPCLEGYTWSI